MLLLREKRNRCPACATGLGSSRHGPLRDICTFQHSRKTFWGLSGYFENLRPEWLLQTLPPIITTSRNLGDNERGFNKTTRVMSKPTTNTVLVLCNGNLAAADGQNLVNHPHCNFACCHVAHGAHKTEPEGLGFLFCFVSIPRRRFS